MHTWSSRVRVRKRSTGYLEFSNGTSAPDRAPTAQPYNMAPNVSTQITTGRGLKEAVDCTAEQRVATSPARQPYGATKKARRVSMGAVLAAGTKCAVVRYKVGCYVCSVVGHSRVCVETRNVPADRLYLFRYFHGNQPLANPLDALVRTVKPRGQLCPHQGPSPGVSFGLQVIPTAESKAN